MDEHLTPEAVQRVFDRAAEEFPEQVKAFRDRQPVASERVPMAFVNLLTELTAGEMHDSATAVAHRVGRRAAQEASTGVMRLAMVLISIPSLLRKLAPVWAQMNTHGAMSFTSEANHATVELAGFPLSSATGCARITGWFEWFAQQAEKTATVRHECRLVRGGDVCRWHLAW